MLLLLLNSRHFKDYFALFFLPKTCHKSPYYMAKKAQVLRNAIFFEIASILKQSLIPIFLKFSTSKFTFWPLLNRFLVHFPSIMLEALKFNNLFNRPMYCIYISRNDHGGGSMKSWSFYTHVIIFHLKMNSHCSYFCMRCHVFICSHSRSHSRFMLIIVFGNNVYNQAHGTRTQERHTS